MTIPYDPAKGIFPRIIAFDWETTGLNLYGNDRGFALALCDEDENTEYIEFKVDPYTRKVAYPKFDNTLTGPILNILGILADPKIAKVGHNVKFDLTACRVANIEVLGEIHDTQLMARSCNTLELSYSLKDLARRYVGINNYDEIELRDTVVSYRRKITKDFGYNTADDPSADYWLASEIEPELGLVKKYCVTDVIRTIKLFQFYEQGIEQLGVKQTYYKELALMTVIREMERKGVEIDEVKLAEVKNKCFYNYLENLSQVQQIYGKPVNINSPKQLARCFITLYIDIKETTKKSGNMSTSIETLENYIDVHPIIKSIISTKSWDTSHNYFSQYTRFKDSKGVIHTSFNQATTKTFRFSSSQPNLQNVSNEDTSTGEVNINGRCAFKPRKGYLWVLIDYNQLELRIFTSRSEEPTFMKVYKQGRDAHNETRLSVPSLAALPEKLGRKIAKIINFLIIYGGGYKALSKQARIPIQQAREFLDQYHTVYYGIRPHMNKAEYIAKSQGFIINAYGRRLNIDPEYAYKAVNYDIQSSAADLMKNAMLSTFAFLKKKKLDAYLVLTIHDEIIYEINEQDFSLDLVRELKALVEFNGGVFIIPTPATVAVTSTYWDEKKDIEV